YLRPLNDYREAYKGKRKIEINIFKKLKAKKSIQDLENTKEYFLKLIIKSFAFVEPKECFQLLKNNLCKKTIKNVSKLLANYKVEELSKFYTEKKEKEVEQNTVETLENDTKKLKSILTKLSNPKEEVKGESAQTEEKFFEKLEEILI